MAMQRYTVCYLLRNGHSAKMTVMARDEADARETASRHGCEDIIKVRRADPLPIASILTTIVVLAGLVAIGCILNSSF